MNIKAKSLVFSLVSASRGRTVSAGEIVAASALFDIAGSNVRVILLRLLAEGLLQQPARGVYELSAHARQLNDEVRLWRTKESRVRPWGGDYAVVLLSRVQKVDSQSKRSGLQALRLMGLKEFQSNLFIRPNNLESGIEPLRQRLLALGLDNTAKVFCANDFDEPTFVEIRSLWDAEALSRRYRREAQKLQEWLQRVDRSDLEVALRESYLYGAEAIREIAFDPMLPDSMVDSVARKAFVEAACRFDDVGHLLWMRFLDQRTGSVASSTFELGSSAQRRAP